MSSVIYHNIFSNIAPTFRKEKLLFSTLSNSDVSFNTGANSGILIPIGKELAHRAARWYLFVILAMNMPHPPYSPDISILDVFLLKKGEICLDKVLVCENFVAYFARSWASSAVFSWKSNKMTVCCDYLGKLWKITKCYVLKSIIVSLLVNLQTVKEKI